ncbi:MAG: penicillin-binding transpeptidase domain-containing protein, partial [Acidobacteriota bacterium]|nr:penicillin-binding transpeptidase domain-containing protein [Acidobacteriota bacterium]
KGGVRTPVRPKAVRRAILPETAATLTSIMEGVVSAGTAKAARLVNFTVAGKTGTADKLVNGRYSASQQNVSFVGFVPSRNPVMTLIVMVDSPRVGGDTGGAIAAPIFKRIADASLRILGVTPTINQPPPVLIARRGDNPVTATAAPMARSIVTMTANMTDGGGLPDLRGLSARDALRELARLGLTARMEGAGVVIEQDPAPGSPIEPGGACTLILNRRPPPRPASAIGDPQ